MNPSAIKNLPKIELHTHLDCGLSRKVVRQLSGSAIGNSYDDVFVGPERCACLKEFLRCIDPSIELLQSRVGLVAAAKDLTQQFLEDGVVYAEVRFAPHLHIMGALSLEEVVEAVLEGFSTAAIPVNLVLCTLRHFNTEMGFEVLKLVQSNLGNGVVAMDLAGDEANFDLSPHIPVFSKASSLDIPFTMHAGEAVGAESVIETLTMLRPARIGHGVRAIEDVSAMQLILDRDIHLEICPSVNLQIGLFPDLAHHPIQRLRSFGLSVGVNTDARTTTNTSLTIEYTKLAEAFEWGEKDFRELNINALDASFANQKIKEELRSRYFA